MNSFWKTVVNRQSSCFLKAQSIPEKMITIPLGSEKSTVIDDRDAGLAAYKWKAVRGRSGLMYVGRMTRSEGKKRLVLLHREIMSPPDSKVVDHINRDTLDNRRSNLRVCSREENTWNRKLQGGRVPNRTGFRGTFFNKGNGRWFSAISVSGKQRHLGYFPSAEAAARAYDAAARTHRGEFAILNFPEEAKS